MSSIDVPKIKFSTLRDQHVYWSGAFAKRLDRGGALLDGLPQSRFRDNLLAFREALNSYALNGSVFVEPFEALPDDFTQRDKLITQAAFLATANTMLGSTIAMFRGLASSGHGEMDPASGQFGDLTGRFSMVAEEIEEALHKFLSDTVTSHNDIPIRKRTYERSRAGLMLCGAPITREDMLYDVCTHEVYFAQAVKSALDISIATKGLLLPYLRREIPEIGLDADYPVPPELLRGLFPSRLVSESLAEGHRAGILMSYHCGYLKPTDRALSTGVARISLESKDIMVQSKDEHLIREAFLLSGERPDLPFEVRNPLPTTLSFGRKGNAGVQFDVDRLIEFFDFMEEVEQNRCGYGPTIFEKAVRAPLIDGELIWEIRGLVQTLGNQTYYSPYAKVGDNSFVGNISKGGHGAAPLDAIASAYRSLLVNISEEDLQAMSMDFLRQTEEYSRRAATVFSDFFTRIKNMLLPDYPVGTIPFTNFSIDYMGRITETGMDKGPYPFRMQPKIIDVNLSYEYIGLESVDRELHYKVVERQRGIKNALFIDLRAIADSAYQ